MKQVVISKDPSVKDNHMAEIYQSNATQQALCRKEKEGEFVRITNFVKCRDFLVDTYSYAKENKDFGIYSFNFAGSKMQPDWNGVYIQMKFHEDKSRENFLDHLAIIQKIEKDNGYETSKVYEVKDSKDFLVLGDKKWLQNCLSFSLYSLLLRCLCYTFKEGKDWINAFVSVGGSDAAYIGSVPRSTLDKTFADLKVIATEEFCGFNPGKHHTGTIHHNSGFISVFGSHTEVSPETVRKNDHWKQMKERGLERNIA